MKLPKPAYELISPGLARMVAVAEYHREILRRVREGGGYTLAREYANSVHKKPAWQHNYAQSIVALARVANLDCPIVAYAPHEHATGVQHMIHVADPLGVGSAYQRPLKSEPIGYFPACEIKYADAQ